MISHYMHPTVLIGARKKIHQIQGQDIEILRGQDPGTKISYHRNVPGKDLQARIPITFSRLVCPFARVGIWRHWGPSTHGFICARVRAGVSALLRVCGSVVARRYLCVPRPTQTRAGLCGLCCVRSQQKYARPCDHVACVGEFFASHMECAA